MADKRRRVNEDCENVKVTLTIDKRLLQKIDDYADEHYMSRSGMVSYSCNQILIADETRRLLKDMNLTLQVLLQKADSLDYEFPEEDRKQLEDMQTAFKLLSGEYMQNNPDLK